MLEEFTTAGIIQLASKASRLLILTINEREPNAYSPYSEVTSGGTLRGMDLAFSHKALSLVQVHEAGHVFPGLLPSVSTSTEKRQRTEANLLKGLLAFPILLIHSASSHLKG